MSIQPSAMPAKRRWRKITSLVVKIGALAFTLLLPVQYALDLQLLGGLWILQTFPALVFGLFHALVPCGSAAARLGRRHRLGIVDRVEQWLKPLATIAIGDASYSFYVGLGALILNIVVAAVGTAVIGLISPNPSSATARP